MVFQLSGETVQFFITGVTTKLRHSRSTRKPNLNCLAEDFQNIFFCCVFNAIGFLLNIITLFLLHPCYTYWGCTSSDSVQLRF
ncbi:hypothetical protein EYF80_019935 [Liparis tanakae]|uniref:Uncharacterized protein n=1 Tax=Liparis tanakae TaxID=230148 RepID=A0A4Z2HVZ6_9TELE|nr:hypothetical protein EYF80_019935 [Liparis tanakae]